MITAPDVSGEPGQAPRLGISGPVGRFDDPAGRQTLQVIAGQRISPAAGGAAA
jgi:hypothetical protein